MQGSPISTCMTGAYHAWSIWVWPDNHPILFFSWNIVFCCFHNALITLCVQPLHVCVPSKFYFQSLAEDLLTPYLAWRYFHTLVCYGLFKHGFLHRSSQLWWFTIFGSWISWKCTKWVPSFWPIQRMGISQARRNFLVGRIEGAAWVMGSRGQWEVLQVMRLFLLTFGINHASS